MESEPSEADTAATAERDALARDAFTGKGNALARTRLVKSIGQDEADKIAITCGLAGIGHFRTIGKPPAAATTDDNGPGDDKTKAPKLRPDGKPANPRLDDSPQGEQNAASMQSAVLGRVFAAN